MKEFEVMKIFNSLRNIKMNKGKETDGIQSYRIIPSHHKLIDVMRYKSEDLEVWKLSIELTDHVYSLCNLLPDQEKFNLKSQLIRAVTSICLNIAEGSTSQSNAEQLRFIGYAIRSQIETIACLRIIKRRNYLVDPNLLNLIETTCDTLFIKLQAFKKSIQ